MKKFFTFLAVATLVAGCSKTDEAIPASTYTITGYSAADTRTEFGEPDAESIPFLWSVGDKVWVGMTQSEALTSGGPSATFTVQGSAPQNGSKVYYNMMATQAANMSTAVVPTAQNVSKSLGENGDFGYAKVKENGTFTLDHATSYLWFAVEALPANATLKSIRLHAGDAIVAGSKQWQGSQFEYTTDNGRSIIDLAVNKTSVSDEEVLAMVVLPAENVSATVTYELSYQGGDTKYYEQTLGERDIEAGKTYKISVNLATVTLKDYVLRTLTFEDNHALFAPYSFEAPNWPATGQEMQTVSVNTWSSLIPAENNQGYNQSFIYGYSEYPETYVDTNYKWGDEGNTNLVQTEFRSKNGYKDFAGGGGYVISKYVGISAETVAAADDAYKHQLSIPVSSAHSGKNFAIGFHNAVSTAPEKDSPMIEFGDGKARVVDHMWITNTSVASWAMKYGSGFSAAFDGDDFLKIEIIGYNGETRTGSVEFSLATGSSIVNDWQQVSLVGLDKVTKLFFRMKEAQLSGEWYCTPIYAAIDDIAVRIE